MKTAVKCDTLCELQDLVNHQTVERTLRNRVFLVACLAECWRTLLVLQPWVCWEGWYSVGVGVGSEPAVLTRGGG